VVACRSQVQLTDRRAVRIAALDFAKCLPFAALILAPGGSLLMPVVVKAIPSFLPTTYAPTPAQCPTPTPTHARTRARTHTVHRFRVPMHDGTQKNIAATLEVATRILHLESRLRSAGHWRAP
jgi:hypothetical protein